MNYDINSIIFKNNICKNQNDLFYLIKLFILICLIFIINQKRIFHDDTKYSIYFGYKWFKLHFLNIKP